MIFSEKSRMKKKIKGIPKYTFLLHNILLGSPIEEKQIFKILSINTGEKRKFTRRVPSY